MKGRFYTVFFLFLATFGTVNACTPLLVPTLVSQAVVGNNLELYWSSNTTYNCTYTIEVEIACINGSFTGLGPFYVSPTINKTSTPYPYPLQTISLSQLCPGTVYQFRAREAYMASTFSAWTATFTFTTPGSPVVPTITVTASPDTVCFPQTSQLNAVVSNACGTATPVYSWVPASTLNNATIQNPVATPTATTTYTCYASGGSLLSCWNVSGSVTVYGGIVVANAGPTVAICIGGNTQLNASGGAAYQWSPATGLSNPNIGNPIASPTTTTQYTVTATIGNCVDTDTMTVTVHPLPVINFSAPDTTGCAPITVTFTNNTLNSTSCSWNFGDGNDSASCGPISYVYAVPGVYHVSLTVTNNNGCVNTATHNGMVQVYGYPTACFTIGNQPTTILEPTIPFTDCSVGAVSWQWAFGDEDNSTSTLQNPTFTYQDTGVFTVQQIVCNSTSCCDTTYMDLYIGPFHGLYVPNAFTPNGDSHNDYFAPEGVGLDLSTYHLWIYDRWGNLIFETTDWNHHWDGTVQGGSGKLVQEDVYVWKVQVDDYMHFHHSLVGHVSVIR
ncbi:MAG: PKD domain-containing protein [Bacteroidota bacterium]